MMAKTASEVFVETIIRAFARFHLRTLGASSDGEFVGEVEPSATRMGRFTVMAG